MIVIRCPHCDDFVEIESLNCGIFRHGAYKNNGQQVPPHSSKELCDKIYKEELIYGCGKPFSVSIQDKNVNVSICDYI